MQIINDIVCAENRDKNYRKWLIWSGVSPNLGKKKPSCCPLKVSVFLLISRNS